jgi:hypothetical protein
VNGELYSCPPGDVHISTGADTEQPVASTQPGVPNFGGALQPFRIKQSQQSPASGLAERVGDCYESV